MKECRPCTGMQKVLIIHLVDFFWIELILAHAVNIKLEGASLRFHQPNSAQEGKGRVENIDTKVNRRALSFFREWQQNRAAKCCVVARWTVHFGRLWSSIIRQRLKIWQLRVPINGFRARDGQSFWEAVPSRTLYGLVCGPKRHLAGRNRDSAVNHLDVAYKRYYLIELVRRSLRLWCKRNARLCVCVCVYCCCCCCCWWWWWCCLTL